IAVDEAGNESTLSDPLSVTIETVAPAAPATAPDLQATSDFGISDTDNITNDTTPTFDVDASGYYRIYRDGVRVGDDYLTAGSYTAQELTDGEYQYTIVAVDLAGNESVPSPALAVTIDTQIPFQSSHLVSKLLADGGAVGDCFSYSVAIDGTTAIVGSGYNDGISSGYASIFEQTELGWVQVAELTSEVYDDFFGRSVAISGNTAIVGAVRDGYFAGAVYVFTKTETGWIQTDKLVADIRRSNDYFGQSVSIDGDTIVVGANRGVGISSYSGSAYIFEQTETGWDQVAKIFADDGGAYDEFGSSVSINGTTILVGAPRNSASGTYSGAAYVFEQNGTEWVQVSKLVADDAVMYGFLGRSVSLSGITAIVGAKNRDAAYVFEKTDSGWVQHAKLVAADAMSGSYFGCSVSIDATIAVVGAYRNVEVGVPTGAAYVFEKTETGWNQIDKLAAPDGAAEDYFGYSVAVSGQAMLLSACRDDDNSTDSGSAYLFSNSPTLDLQTGNDIENITSDVTPTFEVVATPYYRIYRDGVQVSGNYETASTYTSEALPYGTYDFTIVAIDAAGNELATDTPLLVTIALAGDANRDGKVDASDVTVLAGNWQAGVGDGQAATWQMGDFNGDGKVDASDATVLAGNWQAGVTEYMTVVSDPEPETTVTKTPTKFTPPLDATPGIATVLRRNLLPPRQYMMPMLHKSKDAALAESTWSESDYTAIAKDLVFVSAKKSTTAKDKLFAQELDPYADFG
ncbi:MAG: Ig-like domain-containing protein, partial [Planctomycetia bacterium]